MKLYLAGRYSRREQFRELAAELERMGHTVTSRWLYADCGRSTDGRSIVAPDADRAGFAVHDIEDIDAADAVVSFTEAEGPNPGRGGRHVEFGFALGIGKRLIVVGHRENVFHHLPGVEFYASQWDMLRGAFPDAK